MIANIKVSWLRLILIMFGLMILASLMLKAGQIAWSPDLVIWTKNAYPMAKAGVWTGWEAFGARVAHVFVNYYGRAVLTIFMSGLWLWAFWAGIFSCFQQPTAAAPRV